MADENSEGRSSDTEPVFESVHFDQDRRPLCANTTNGQCENGGIILCELCLLIKYCSKECRAQHEREHVVTVHGNPRMSNTWMPELAFNWLREWLRQKSAPDSVFGNTYYKTRRETKTIFGTTVAVDVLNLAHNEGLPHEGNLDVLITDARDLRFVIKTIVDYPSGAKPLGIGFVLMEKDYVMVARNLIILLIAASLDRDEAPELMMHYFYSAFLRREDLEYIAHYVRPLLTPVYEELQAIDGDDTLHTHAFALDYPTIDLQVTLPKSRWMSFDNEFLNADKMTFEAAQSLRQIAGNNSLREIDQTMQHDYCLPARWRLSIDKYRREGILLPFSNSSSDFRTPNPSFFSTDWIPSADADPLCAWNMNKAEEAAAALEMPPHDLHGKLCKFLLATFTAFHGRIREQPYSFSIICGDIGGPNDNPVEDYKDTFDRILVPSRLDDMDDNLRLRVFERITRCLKQVDQNEYATIVGVFVNAFDLDFEGHISHDSELGHSIATRLRIPGVVGSRNDLNTRKLSSYLRGLENLVALRDRMMTRCRLHDMASNHKMVVRGLNTVVDQWPLRKTPDAKKQSLERYFLMSRADRACFVEWRRFRQGLDEAPSDEVPEKERSLSPLKRIQRPPRNRIDRRKRRFQHMSRDENFDERMRKRWRPMIVADLVQSLKRISISKREDNRATSQGKRQDEESSLDVGAVDRLLDWRIRSGEFEQTQKTKEVAS